MSQIFFFNNCWAFVLGKKAMPRKEVSEQSIVTLLSNMALGSFYTCQYLIQKPWLVLSAWYQGKIRQSILSNCSGKLRQKPLFFRKFPVCPLWSFNWTCLCFLTNLRWYWLCNKTQLELWQIYWGIWQNRLFLTWYC